MPAPPTRDWLVDDPTTPAYRDPVRFPYVTEVESYRDRVRRTRTWNWLCGNDREDVGADYLATQACIKTLLSWG